ncbi:FAD-dependent oxidoreductase [Candidatus Latescibacterota bacterium]
MMRDSGSLVQTSARYDCDVLVIGSGVSGYCAAIQAAREGCDVVLLEKDEVLGGNSGPNLGVGITGADRYNAFGTETGIIHELQEEAAWVNAFTPISAGTMPYNISRRNEAVVQSALEQAGVRILKRHFACAPVMREARICGILAEDLAAFRSVEIGVKGVVVEASGDGHIGALAGAEYAFGSEGSNEYGERSAPPEPRSWVQGTSLVALARKTDHPVEFIPPPGTGEFTPRLWHGRIASFIQHGHGRFTGDTDLIFLYITEAGGDLDTIRDDGRIYELLLGQLWAEWDHIKNGPHREESLHWDLLWVSPKAGKRESRRFLGDVIVAQTDLEAGRRFPDDIAYGGHDLDDHQSLGAAGSNIFGHSIPPMYGIPFRSCYSRNLDNLLLAGRLISASHLAHSSTRLMRTGGAIGQAVGLAAALCCAYQLTPRQLYEQRLGELQHRLVRRDGTILCRALEDPEDLARSASVSASSETHFNEQELDRLVPLVAPAGNLLWDWPQRLEQVEVYLRNDGDQTQPMTLTVLRARRDPPLDHGGALPSDGLE